MECINGISSTCAFPPLTDQDVCRGVYSLLPVCCLLVGVIQISISTENNSNNLQGSNVHPENGKLA